MAPSPAGILQRCAQVEAALGAGEAGAVEKAAAELESDLAALKEARWEDEDWKRVARAVMALRARAEGAARFQGVRLKLAGAMQRFRDGAPISEGKGMEPPRIDKVT